MSSQNNTVPILERRYLEEPEACERAVELLLKKPVKRGRLPDKSGPDDGRKDQDAATQTHCT
jgi:hypothetical protein